MLKRTYKINFAQVDQMIKDNYSVPLIARLMKVKTDSLRLAIMKRADLKNKSNAST